MVAASGAKGLPFSMPSERIVGAGSQYMSTAKDKSGAWLDGGKHYRLRVP